jgi:hypothetical protein
MAIEILLERRLISFVPAMPKNEEECRIFFPIDAM